MNTKTVPTALFAGIPERLQEAYPQELRREIADRVNILPMEMDAENWRAHLPALRQADVIMATWGMPSLTPEFLAAAENLKAVFYAAGSVKGFATDAAFERGIVISSARRVNAIAVAEYAAAVVVLSLKQFWAYARTTRETRSWARSIPVPGTCRATVGLVSLGATGRQTAGILSRLDCDLIVYDPTVSEEGARALGVRLVSLEDLFRRADVVSVHAPLLPETRGMITASLLGLLKPGATLINTSRGAVINEKEMCGVLAARPDITAVLDVLDPEPPDPQSPLFFFPNVVLTPHISGSMGTEIERMGRWMFEELKAHLCGSPLSHRVTRKMLLQMA